MIASLDANVLVYSVDSANEEKRLRAKLVIGVLYGRGGMVTLQTLGEFFSVAVRKSKMRPSDAMRVVGLLRSGFEVVAASSEDADLAMEAVTQGRLSYWDVLLLATLGRHGCTRLVSEDMTGAVFVGVTVLDPFVDGFDPASLERLD